MMKTLAEYFPSAHAKLKAADRENVAKMFERFHLNTDVDRALGLNDGATRDYALLRRLPDLLVEKRAGEWLAQNPECRAETTPTRPQPAPTDETILMVVVPPKKVGKVQRVLALMGCEVEPI